MKTLRDYIDLVNERFNQALSEKVTLPADGSTPQTQTVNGVTMNAPANAVQTGSGGVLKTGSGAAVTSGTPAPAPDAAAAAKAKLTPSQLKWLGGADATDQYIMARMPKPQPGETAPGAAPAQAAQAAPATMSAADQEDADMGAAMKANQAAAIGANQDAEDLAMGQAMTANAAQAAALASGAQDDATGVDAAVAANAAAPAVAQSAQAAPNRDSMPFGQAFADARAKGEKQFTWKGKPYAVKLAPTAPAAKPVAPAAPTQKELPQGMFKAPAQSGQATVMDPNKPGFDFKKASAAANAAKPVAKEGRTERNDHAFIDELNAMRSIAGLPTRNKW